MMMHGLANFKLSIEVSCELNNKELLTTHTPELRGLAAMLQGTTASRDRITQDVFLVFFRFPTTKHEYSLFVTFFHSD